MRVGNACCSEVSKLLKANYGRSSNLTRSYFLRRTNRMMSDKGFVMPPEKKFRQKISTEFSIDHSGLLGITRDMTDRDDQYSESRQIIADMRKEMMEEMKTGRGEDHMEPTEAIQPHKEAKSKLATDLLAYIKMRGPITLHDYIAQTSNHIVHGYYQQNAEKIGSAGDFVTSPEISQVFGEVIAVWLLSAWKSLGSPKNVSLVELGPGKGTLMKDILRIISQFPDFKDSISVHMVELSDAQRKLQREALGCSEGEITKSNSGITRMTNDDGIPISWYDSFSSVSNSEPVLLVAQEFLDVFPVHQFVYTNKGWREKLVDIDRSLDSTYHFRQVLATSETPAMKALLGNLGLSRKDDGSNIPQDGGSSPSPIPLRNNVTQTTTENSETVAPVGLIGEASAGNIDGNTSAATAISTPEPVTPLNVAKAPKLTVGDEIEVSPLALSSIEYISKRVFANRGAVLFIDYGEEFTQGDSLRAYKKHKQVSLYSEPGMVDITADVDFSLCKKTAEKSGVKVHGSITQGEFLMRMGILERVQALIELDSTTDEEAGEMVASFRRLVGDGEGGLGKRFKVMALTDPETKIEGFY